jgi:branched-chain amino acid transport system permease protein
MESAFLRKEVNAVQRFLDLLSLSPVGIFLLGVVAILPLFPPFNQEYLIRWLVAAAIIGGQAIAFDFTTGYIGIVNFGFGAIVGIGSYTSALLVIHLGVSPWIGMIAGAGSAAIVGFLTGILTLRLRGIFALCMTWFIGLALMGLAIKMVWLTRGSLGLRCPVLFETSSNLPYFYTALIMLAITYFVLKGIVRSHVGLAFKAIGQNMEAARTSGINPTYYRILNFTISCAFAGWTGGFYAHYYGILTPDIMHTNKTVEVLVIAYIGGRVSLWGGAFTAFPFIISMELLRSSLSELPPGLNLLIYGVLLVLIMIYYPGGVAQLYRTLFAQSRNPVLQFLTKTDTRTQKSAQV